MDRVISILILVLSKISGFNNCSNVTLIDVNAAPKQMLFTMWVATLLLVFQFSSVIIVDSLGKSSFSITFSRLFGQ
jgi:hypothetical protein